MCRELCRQWTYHRTIITDRAKYNMRPFSLSHLGLWPIPAPIMRSTICVWLLHKQCAHSEDWIDSRCDLLHKQTQNMALPTMRLSFSPLLSYVFFFVFVFFCVHKTKVRKWQTIIGGQLCESGSIWIVLLLGLNLFNIRHPLHLPHTDTRVIANEITAPQMFPTKWIWLICS